ncbi:MAG: methionine--tRNA ligase [Mycoplasmatales bacterium]|nr:methionine--tRNA ligase [Mycoplasmatales bacterium]
MSKKTFYITTPIYYPSGSLHIGHVYTTTLARTLANFKILCGYDVKMLTGSDEHGQKIEEKANQAGLNPQIYVNERAEEFKDLWKKLEIQYDYFSRTSNKAHMESVSKQFAELFKKGDIVKGTYNGLYSIQDEEFVATAQALKKDGKYYHPLSGHELESVEEESYFFRMSKYSEWWKKYLKENPNFIIPHKIVNELKNNFISKGLEDLSITRSTFSWGIPVKEDKNHVMYVWLDALNNYITALGYKTNDQSDFIKYWSNGDEIVHIVGKEITRFHGIYWPIILESIGLRKPTTILSHGWIITSQGKMSKSKGNVINPLKIIDKYGAEIIKYYFASKMPINNDNVFSEDILKTTYNSDLSNNYGNLLSRTIAMIKQNFDKPVKHIKPIDKTDVELLNEIIEHKNTFINELNNYQISSGLESVMQLGKKLNGYIDITKPWTLKENKERLSQILNNLLNGIYAMTTMLSIVIPKKANQALKILNQKDLSLEKIEDFSKFDETIFGESEILFERMK